jgi:sulfur carrier protein
VESVITGSYINAVGKLMKVTIHLLPAKKEKKVVELDKGASVEQAIRALGLFPDAWIPVREDMPLPLDEQLKDGDVLKLISVVSGG